MPCPRSADNRCAGGEFNSHLPTRKTCQKEKVLAGGKFSLVGSRKVAAQRPAYLNQTEARHLCLTHFFGERSRLKAKIAGFAIHGSSTQVLTIAAPWSLRRLTRRIAQRKLKKGTRGEVCSCEVNHDEYESSSGLWTRSGWRWQPH